MIHGLLEHAMRHERATRDDLRRLAVWLSMEEPKLRAVIEDAVSLGLRQQEITPSVLANRVATTDRNLSYVAAIVRAIRER